MWNDVWPTTAVCNAAVQTIMRILIVYQPSNSPTHSQSQQRGNNNKQQMKRQQNVDSILEGEKKVVRKKKSECSYNE